MGCTSKGQKGHNEESGSSGTMKEHTEGNMSQNDSGDGKEKRDEVS